MSGTAARFWRAARGIAAGLTAFVPAAAALATGVPDVMEKFVRGSVTGLKTDGILVKTAEGSPILLQLSPATKIWNDTYVKTIPVEIGDQVTAWVSRRGGRGYQVDQLWVNWIGLQGAAGGVRVDGPGVAFEISHPPHPAPTVRIHPQTQVATRDARAAFAENPVSPAEGEWVQVIGRKLPEGGVLATEMFLPRR